MALFSESEKQLDDLKGPDLETLEVPKSRIGTPEAVRKIYEKLKTDDEAGAYNRSLIQGQRTTKGRMTTLSWRIKASPTGSISLRVSARQWSMRRWPD